MKILKDITYTIIDPEVEGVHPMRLKMTDDDWARLDRVMVKETDEYVTTEELEAYADWLYDEIAARKQTHYGTTILQ